MELFPESINDMFTINPVQSKKLQRTEKWHEDRNGKFTGSTLSDLMGCSQSTSKMEWGRPEKLIDFGETAKKYVFSKAKERQSNIVLERSIGINGDYGTNVEPQIITLLQEKYPNLEFKEVGFIEFLEGIAGASPDGYFYNSTGLEMKAAMSWDGVYSRFEIPFDQKHQDFWQIQCEMLALKVNEMMYVIADPAKDIYNPIITNIQEKIVHSSEIHQKAIIQRCLIGNAAIEMYLDGMNFHEAIRKACTEFEF